MGKQSGRLYYNGEDHFDLVFKENGKDESFANHSKIYLGNKLIWQREKPKFLLIGNCLSTTETFKGISEFFNTDLSINSQQVSFFAEYYFLAARNKIYISQNGYDWKFMHETERNVVYMERLGASDADAKGVLVIITTNKVIYCQNNGGNLFDFENKCDIDLRPNYHEVISSGKRILFCFRRNVSTYIQPPNVVISSEKIYEREIIYGCHAGKENGCFYRYSVDVEKIRGIYKSYDGISWSYFCENPEFDTDGVKKTYRGSLFEYKGKLCMFIPSLSINNGDAFVMKVESAQKHILMQEKEGTINSINIFNDRCLLPYLHKENGKFAYAACITDNLFSTQYDGHNFVNAEPIKKTTGFDRDNRTYYVSSCASKEIPFIFYYIE